MRSRHRPTGVSSLVLVGLTAVLAGCSSGGTPDSMATSSLRPQESMQREGVRHYPDGSSSGGYYPANGDGRPYAEAPRRYVDPGEPTPREIAAYDSGHDRMGPPQNIQTASIGNSPRAYDPNARWQQPSSAITTGSTGPRPTGYGTPYRPQPIGQHVPQVVEVQQGDTLFSLSRRYNVPVGDLVAANRLPNDRIAIGQRLVIPTRYR